MNLKYCPFCGSTNIIDKYVYMQCNTCHARGPWVNNGINDDHVDYISNQHAQELWNKRWMKI